MSSSAVLSTLEHVTQTKLDRLSRKRNAFEASAQKLHADMADMTDDSMRVSALCEFLKSSGIKSTSCELSYENIQLFLGQAENDNSIPQSKITGWKDALAKEVERQKLRYQYTSLCGELVMEWLQNPNDIGQQGPEADESDDSGESFEPVGREEMHEQRREWESYAFKAAETDANAIHAYLDKFFLDLKKERLTKMTPLEMFRRNMETFDDHRRIIFDADNVKQSIKNLIKADLFAGEKRKALVDLQSRKDLLTEIADVLNADIESLDSWNWDPSPVPLQLRKQINGKYRFYMDEEIYQAIFLQYIGTQWAVHIKRAALSFFRSGAWKRSTSTNLSREEMQRREYFLDKRTHAANTDKSVQKLRREIYESDYFLTQVPDSVDGDTRDYADDESNSSSSNRKSPLEVKQQILVLITTESLINKQLYGSFSVVQSDFKWFGPSLPHSTILAVLAYFHVPQKWRNFFLRFLTPDLVFPSDGKDAETRTRQRGIPMSHQLSDALGEMILFTLDFAVNQRTRGWNLYRFHDDMFFWHWDDKVCATAWKTITEFADIMGLELNEEKTGSATLSSNAGSQRATKGLPQGDIDWGFLKLDAESGRWVVKQENLDEHIAELKRQLATRRSTLAFIQAYNAYVGRFFLNNLGKPTICLGQSHVDLILTSIQKVQRGVFSDFDAQNIIEYLKNILATRFNVHNVPDGFLYFPFSLGGLAIQNPIIHCQAYRARSKADPATVIERSIIEDKDEYEDAKEKYENGKIVREDGADRLYPIGEEPEFFSLEEYNKPRERFSTPLYGAYSQLMRETEKETVKLTTTLEEALDDYNFRFPDANWVFELYGWDVIEIFGGLEMAEKYLLPIALLDMLKDEKVRWAG